MLLTVEDVLAITAAVATGSVPVLLTYFFNERSARAQLEREQEYGRRREKYEQALGALRRLRSLLQVYQAFLRFQNQFPGQAIGAEPPGGTTEPPKVPDELGLLISKIFAVIGDVLTERETPSLAPEEFMAGKKEDRSKVVGIVIDSTMRGFGRAGLEIESSLTSLMLVDADEDFIERAWNLNSKLTLPQGDLAMDFLKHEYDWKAIESELGDMELIAFQDLKSVLGTPVDVELTRSRPLKSVATKTRKSRPPPPR